MEDTTRETGRGRVQLAQHVLEMLPPMLGALEEPKEEVTELLLYRLFFAVWDALAGLEQLQMNKESCASWLNDYKVRFPLSSPLFYF